MGIKINDRWEVQDESGRMIGTADYSGRVTDGWREKGSIDNDRYTDEYGRDRGWVTKGSASSDVSSGGGGAGGLLGLILVLGIFYLLYKAASWFIEQGKISSAHASRSWGFAGLFVPFASIAALSNGYRAKKAIDCGELPAAYKGIADVGLVFGFMGSAF